MRIAMYVRQYGNQPSYGAASIADQINDITQWANNNGHEIVEAFIDPGVLISNGYRQVFYAMMDVALSENCQFDMIVVHSFCRFGRNAAQRVMYMNKLNNNSVRLYSLEEPDDPNRIIKAIARGYCSPNIHNGKHKKDRSS